MRGLTICQPYATLIVGRLEDLESLANTALGCHLVEQGISLTPKRVENRPRPYSVRGELLIHAGLSDTWLAGWKRAEAASYLDFGAIVGVVKIIGSFRVVESALIAGDYMPERWALRQWPWLACHPHVLGPGCLVFDNVRRFRRPVAWRGAQGFWNAEPTPELQQAIDDAEPIEWSPT